MKTLADALALLRRQPVMTLAGPGGEVPSLASEVAGAPVRGSWWGHPKGKSIFRLAGELADHEDVLPMKLAGGKVTFVYRALWPAVFRLATDAARVAAARSRLSAGAARLLRDVEAAGSLRLDRHAGEARLDTKALKRASAELEDAALLLSAQEHGERGAHVTVLRTWADWAEASVRDAAAALSLADARSAIARACGEARTPFSGVESKDSSKPVRRSR